MAKDGMSLTRAGKVQTHSFMDMAPWQETEEVIVEGLAAGMVHALLDLEYEVCTCLNWVKACG